jgi:hypothetical protein
LSLNKDAPIPRAIALPNAAQRRYRSTPPTVVRPVPLQPSSP